MDRLASPIDTLKPHYTAIVVGSGYGGAIAASRLARAGQQVCLLERGRKFLPGEYPDTPAEALREFQVDAPVGHVGSAAGLYDFRLNRDINVFVGCGLGGTSLVNANVSLRAEPRVFGDPRWPASIRNGQGAVLNQFYARAQEMLKPTSYPTTATPLAKLHALEQSAAAMGQPCYRPPINVTFKDGVNHVGVEQRPCTLCGDCVSGCNHAAKNTVLMNYLPDARNHGAEIFTEVVVRRLARDGDRWRVFYRLVRDGRARFGAPELSVTGDIVVLAAGTLGSTEILLRSRAAGLPLSGALGTRFTGNGDVLAFGYNCDQPINAVGFGHHPPAGREPVGPCISGIIDMRQQPALDEGMVIEEGSVPGALGTLLPVALAAAAAVTGRDTDSGVADLVRERRRELESLVQGPHHGAVHNTQVYLVMAHDDAGGVLELDDDRLRVDWPGAGGQPVFQRVADRLEEATRPLGGTFVPNPAWSTLASQNLVTVHPLGGCVMADDAARGVVNDRGQVFAGSTGTAVHEGLYVCDGAVVPRSLGVNPLLTISALAERSCWLLAQDHGWTVDYRLPSVPSRPPAPRRLGLEFTETMRGWASRRVELDYDAAARQGEADGAPLEFTLTIRTDDLERMLADPEHHAGFIGTVTAPWLSPAPLATSDGVFNLFPLDPARPNARQMRYRMGLTAVDGSRYFFEGFKTIHDDRGPDVWGDTTTLHVTVRSGDAGGAPVAKGVLRILPADLLRQMTTMTVRDAASPVEQLAAMARFGRFFAGTVFDTYGGIFARPTPFDPGAPPRKKRPLRAGAPEVHPVTARDGVALRLTRYRGGPRGPVILTHGLGVSSAIFAIDTIETNLVEFLFALGFDVWLLDYRVSIELPAASRQWSGDDVAAHDYPAAVARVKEVTGAGAVQVVAHCFGATTFVMAMLGGLEGVRSAVCSQIGPHVVVPPATALKSGLHMPSFLEALGVRSLTAYVDTNADWGDRLFDAALRLYPIGERCPDAVCRRITFLYAPLYEHAQLNAATHAALHEMFGVASIRALDHLAAICRAGQVVGADGSDRYLPHLERLAIPLTFIHGGLNQCFLPESTARSVEALRARNGDVYQRHVVPGYGHIDCIFGRDAARDVYPLIAGHLERT